MFLRNRDWSYPLENLDRKFDEHYDVTAEKFHIARSDFLREWRFLEILWGRLQDDYRIFYESQSQIKEGTFENFKHRVRIGRLLMRSLECIHLDTNCFLLNARILMDRVAYLTTFLWRKMAKQQPKWGSFNKHKKSIKKLHRESKIIDEDYASYITQHTDWFKDKLKDIRDDLIVHRKGSYVDVFKEVNSGIVMQGKAVFKDKDGKVVVEYDMKQIPDLNELMDNICDFLSFFDKHFSQML